jgi:hypothetical protein
MDYQCQMLAHAEYRLSNQLERKAKRTELLDARERRFRLPRPRIPAVRAWFFHLTMIDGLASRTEPDRATPRV